MIRKRKYWIIILIVSISLSYIHCTVTTPATTTTAGTTATTTASNVTTTTAATTAASNVTTATTSGSNVTTTTVTNTTTQTTAATTTTEAGYVTTVTTNNVTWMVVGVICGVLVVGIAVIAAALAFASHKKKRVVHPDSDTESICSTYNPCSDPDVVQTRPTTASHIFFDDTEPEEAMSKPVSMTPFELRKLYIETFPYSNWKRGFDGTLRPHMNLKFVEPSVYSKTKEDESFFRDKIQNFEMSDSLTLRSTAVSRMMRRPMAPACTLSPLPEGTPPGFRDGDQQDDDMPTNVLGDEAEL